MCSAPSPIKSACATRPSPTATTSCRGRVAWPSRPARMPRPIARRSSRARPATPTASPRSTAPSMSRRLLAIIGALIVVGGILMMSSFFIVDQTEQALVLQLGEVRRVIRQPGLWIKRPFIENVVFYDNRVLDFEPPHEEVIVSDQKRLVADTYTRYRITNPLLV